MNPITLYPTAVIGLGTSGLKVLEELESLWYEHFGHVPDPRSSFLRLINIETADSPPRPTPGGTAIQQLRIDPRQKPFDQQVAELRKSGMEIAWAEEINWARGVGQNGAGGSRPAGRVLLERARMDAQLRPGLRFDIDFSHSDTLARLAAELRLALGDLARREPGDPERPVHVFVVGTLTGGTCSGMAIQIGQMVKQILGGATTGMQVVGVFFISPTRPEFTDELSDEHRCMANSLGALYELQETIEAFQSKGVRPPYGYVYILAPEYAAERGFSRLDTLFEITALKLFCDIVGVQQQREADLTDAFTNDPSAFFFTFGIAAAQYPGHLMTALVGTQLAQTALHQWSNESEFLDETHKWLSIDKGQIRRLAQKDVTQWIEKLRDELEGDWATLRKADVERLLDNPDASVSDKFSRPDGEYQSTVTARRTPAREKVRSLFRTSAVEILRSSASLAYLEEWMSQVVDALALHRDLWSAHEPQLPDTRRTWKPTERYQQRVEEARHSFSLRFLFNQRPVVVEEGLRALCDELVAIELRDLLHALEQDVERWRVQCTRLRVYLSTHASNLETISTTVRRKLEATDSPIKRFFIRDIDWDAAELRKRIVADESLPPSWNQLGRFNADWLWSVAAQGPDNNGHWPFQVDELSLSLQEVIAPQVDAMCREHSFDIHQRCIQEKAEIATKFQRVERGYLRYEGDPVDELQFGTHVGRIPHYLIAESSSEAGDVRGNLSAIQQGATTKEHRTFKDCIVYYRDVPRLRPDYLTHFSRLVEAFRTSPHPNELSHEQWIRHRLAQRRTPRYRVLAKRRADEIHQLLQFVRWFWISWIRQPDESEHATVWQPPPPMATLRPDRRPLGAGLAIDPGGRAWVAVESLPGVPLEPLSVVAPMLNTNDHSEEALEGYCSDDKNFKALCDVVQGHVLTHDQIHERWMQNARGRSDTFVAEIRRVLLGEEWEPQGRYIGGIARQVLQRDYGRV